MSSDSLFCPCFRSRLASAITCNMRHALVMESLSAAGHPASASASELYGTHCLSPPTLRMSPSRLRRVQPCMACLMAQSSLMSNVCCISAIAFFSWISVVHTAGRGCALQTSPPIILSSIPLHTAPHAAGLLLSRKAPQASCMSLKT